MARKTGRKPERNTGAQWQAAALLALGLVAALLSVVLMSRYFEHRDSLQEKLRPAEAEWELALSLDDPYRVQDAREKIQLILNEHRAQSVSTSIWLAPVAAVVLLFLGFARYFSKPKSFSALVR